MIVQSIMIDTLHRRISDLVYNVLKIKLKIIYVHAEV